MISVDTYPFLAFSDLTYPLEDTGIYFLVALCCLILRRTNLEVGTKEASPSADKNTGVVLVPCHAWKHVPTAISDGADISEVPGCHLF